MQNKYNYKVKPTSRAQWNHSERQGRGANESCRIIFGKNVKLIMRQKKGERGEWAAEEKG